MGELNIDNPLEEVSTIESIEQKISNLYSQINTLRDILKSKTAAKNKLLFPAKKGDYVAIDDEDGYFDVIKIESFNVDSDMSWRFRGLRYTFHELTEDGSTHMSIRVSYANDQYTEAGHATIITKEKFEEIVNSNLDAVRNYVKQKW